MQDGESEEQTLLREVEEELGVKATILCKGRRWHFPRLKDGKRVDVQNYECSIASENIVLSDEHIRYEWLTIEEIRDYPVKDESLYASLE